jgi:hypothetical protein
LIIKCPKCHFENLDDTIYCGKCASPLKPGEDILVTKTLETPIEELTRGSLLQTGMRLLRSWALDARERLVGLKGY